MRWVMQFSIEDLDLLRQWFDCIEDVNPSYLTDDDRTLAAYIKQQLHLAYAEKAGELK